MKYRHKGETMVYGVQARLAKETGLSRGMISQWMLGNKTLGIQAALKIKAVTGLSMDVLTGPIKDAREQVCKWAMAGSPAALAVNDPGVPAIAIQDRPADTAADGPNGEGA